MEPTSWVDYGCFEHDKAYDTTDNATMLAADRRLLHYLLHPPRDIDNTHISKRRSLHRPAPQSTPPLYLSWSVLSPPATLSSSRRASLGPSPPYTSPAAMAQRVLTDAHAQLYRAFAIAGLAAVMIPYRSTLQTLTAFHEHRRHPAVAPL